MKNLVLLLVLMPFLAFGQQNFPLIKDGGIWRVARAAINTPPDPWSILILLDGLNSGFYQAEIRDANQKSFKQKLIIK